MKIVMFSMPKNIVPVFVLSVKTKILIHGQRILVTAVDIAVVSNCVLQVQGPFKEL